MRSGTLLSYASMQLMNSKLGWRLQHSCTALSVAEQATLLKSWALLHAIAFKQHWLIAATCLHM